KSPRRVLQIPGETTPREEFVVAMPDSTRLKAKTSIIKRDVGNEPATVSKTAPRDRVPAHAFLQPHDQPSTSRSSPKLGSTTRNKTRSQKTNPQEGEKGRKDRKRAENFKARFDARFAGSFLERNCC